MGASSPSPASPTMLTISPAQVQNQHQHRQQHYQQYPFPYQFQLELRPQRQQQHQHHHQRQRQQPLPKQTISDAPHPQTSYPLDPTHHHPQHRPMPHRKTEPAPPRLAKVPSNRSNGSNGSTRSSRSTRSSGSNNNNNNTNGHIHTSPPAKMSRLDAEVAQALEIARESPDGEQDATISSILERALAESWARVQADPESYIMTRDEFAVFNFFQHRFKGNHTAVKARGRFWDNLHA